MKLSFSIPLLLLMLILNFGCTKSQQNSANAYVTANIGTINYSSKKDNVNVNESAAVPNGTVGGQFQVTITANDDNATSTNKSYLVIAVGYNPGDIKTYDVGSKQAICSYHKSGSTQDDIAQTGTVTITSNHANDAALGHQLDGSFDFITYGGVHVTNGSFTVYVSN